MLTSTLFNCFQIFMGVKFNFFEASTAYRKLYNTNENLMTVNFFPVHARKLAA